MSTLVQAGRALFHDEHPPLEDFRAAVLAGLRQPQKSLPSKFFYDARGSALFDDITTLDEYYPTRTEIALLRDHAADMKALTDPGCQLIEFGSASSAKIRILLKTFSDLAAYVAIDISRDHLLRSADALAADFPHIQVMAVCADYTRLSDLPAAARVAGAGRIGFFPGSSIGNFTPEQAVAFLAQIAGMVAGGALIIGVDLKKDAATLDAAYNDSRGVTAAFNLNVLARINRELGGNIDLAGFAHKAFYAEAPGRIEMHLVSRRHQTIHIAGQAIDFAEGESIHTENSYKYGAEEFRDIAVKAGFTPRRLWTDARDLFSIHYLEAR